MKTKSKILCLALGIAAPLQASTLDFSTTGGLTSTYVSTYAGLSTTPGVMWSPNGGANAGHLWLNGWNASDTFTFSSPTFVNSFDMTSLRYLGDTLAPAGNLSNGLLIDIAGYNSSGTKVWNTTVNLTGTTFEKWLTVDVNVPDITKLTFFGPGDTRGIQFSPSIDNLVLNERNRANVPDAGGSALILGMGAASLAAFRRKRNASL